MEHKQEDIGLLEKAERRLRRLSPARLGVAEDFLAHLKEREENEATGELLSIPGFEENFREAVQQTDAGEVVSFERIRRDVGAGADSQSAEVLSRGRLIFTLPAEPLLLAAAPESLRTSQHQTELPAPSSAGKPVPVFSFH